MLYTYLLSFYLDFQYSRLLFLAMGSVKNYLMISAVLICKDCGLFARIIVGTMQGIIIIAVLPVFFVNTEPTNELDFSILLEQIDIL